MQKPAISAAAAASIGLLALASAMGIGRFSLTPMLPLMQQDAHLTLTVGGWLATGNYIGYLAGALVCILMTPRPAPAIRWGLVGVGLTTLLMGFSEWPALWLALRFLSGVASAFVLVGTSAWAMPILRQHGKEDWSAHVFSGVGIGIAFAGLFGLAAGIDAWSSRVTWIVLGAVAAVLAVMLWQPLAVEAVPQAQAGEQRRRALPRPALVAAGCYAAFGFGYIIPATFLPALARGYIDDPAMFGLIWPVFGAAAALSTLASAFLGRSLAPRQLWTRAKWVLSAGVLAPALAVNVPTLLLSAVCVGGTFMIITMAGIKEALRLGGAPASLAVGVMTAAFGAGQIAGPLMVSLLGRSGHAFAFASIIAAACLVAGNCVLMIFDHPVVPEKA
ncbi:MAG TPA: YbfB/YjiJ family MFS transporter [Bradyrhizobium sp.]|uniref:YbfB/YjiJ family MFS transporter n=1 Tax=Bradyrhizobium sp. TaxID=376 RepID=UPI002BA08FD5|nr:YbfB/YjiJ family MFS transporter [Bradyrhizobium sp.]HLZ02982.1 YbfB/YjiJ family MFS transporter [Bradyrhizobium sp.]